MWRWVVAAAVMVGVFVCVSVLAPQPGARAEPGRCTELAPTPRGYVVDDEPVGDRLACTDLRGVDFTQDDLNGADLHGSDLRDADLTQADLIGADLTGADLTGADLGQADLRGATLTGAILRGADLIQTDLTGVDARGADFADADLTQAYLIRADLRDTNLRGTSMSGADVDDLDLRGANLEDIAWFEAGSVRFDTASLDGYRQISWFVFWPALGLAVAWWRARTWHLVRHRATTRVRLTEVVGSGVAIACAMGGVYLLVTGAARGMSRLALAWLHTIDPGPLALVAVEPLEQLLAGGIALVVGVVLFRLARWRREPPRKAASTGQVVMGAPERPRRVPALTGLGRRVAGFVVAAGLVDLVTMLVLKVVGGLPSTGPWRDDAAWGHLATAALVTVVALRLSGPGNPRPGQTAVSGLRSLTGVVLAGGGREPYLLASGKTVDDAAVSRVLPWSALTHVHLIRTFGVTHADKAMVTLHQPGAVAPTEYPAELHVSATQVDHLRRVLPPEMITDVVRVPSTST